MTHRFTFITAIAGLLLTGGTIMAQVSVTTKLPATVAPGGSFTVELNVVKGDISGFAKLQQQLPTGFTATVGETANATFSFKDQKVKFLWMALPNNDFTVSYNVGLDPSLSGNQIIEGTFAYIEGSETERFIIPKDIISIQADQAEAAKQAAMDHVLADQQAKEDAAEAARQEASGTEDATAEEDPTVETTEITGTAHEVAEVAVDNSEEDARREEEARRVREADEARHQAEEARTHEAKEAAPETNYNDAMMKSKPGLVFRVQVAAGPNRVDPSFFKNKYGISEPIVIEEHEGLYKYVVNEFGSYRPAKTFSNELRDSNGVDGPFVTAYSDGVRIHVKEALDIAGQ